MGLSPDGKYAIALIPSQRTKLRVYPTGAGRNTHIRLRAG